MAYVTVSFNGVNYQIPAPGSTDAWGVFMNQFLTGLASGAPGLNAINTFTAEQAFAAGGYFTEQVPPGQLTGGAQLYTSNVDGYLYTIPSSTHGAPATPIKIGAGGGSVTPPYLAKTADYVILPADEATRFSNLGALGPVQFTLPTPAASYEFYFACVAAQNLSVSGGTFHGPGGMTGTTVTAYGTIAANRYTSFKVACYDGATWVVQELTGTVVVS